MPSILFETGSTMIGGAERVVLRLTHGLRKCRPDWRLDCVVLTERGGLEGEYQAAFDHVWDGPPLYKDSSWRIIGLVDTIGYDIVHAIDSFQLVAAAAALCPTTHFLQNVFPNVGTSPYAPSATWIALQTRHYSALVTEIKGNLEHLPQPGRPPHILEAIPNGIDTEFWTRGGRSCPNIDVTWCARTDQEKGIDRAMELIPLLCGAGMEYMIVTSEPDGPHEALKALTAEWPTLHHAAGLSPKELRAVFRHTEIFLSTSSVEGMPATPLEAAACGCRPFVPAIDGLVEVFEEGARHGFLYSPAIPINHLARRIKTLLAHPEIDDRKPDGAPDPAEGCHYAREIAERYSADIMVQRYLALYEKLLATPF